MKNENDKVRAFALGVIEKLKNARSMQIDEDWVLCYNKSIKIVQSLIPKEEDTKTESDEVKAGDEVRYAGKTFTLIHQWGNRCWIHAGGQDFGYFVHAHELSKPEPTLEQKARKKAEEIVKYYIRKPNEDTIKLAIDLILFDPKTL